MDFTDPKVSRHYDRLACGALGRGGRKVKSATARALELGVPAVYPAVWLARDPAAQKIQAIAMSGKGKKQYYYSPEHETARASKRKRAVPGRTPDETRDKKLRGWQKARTMAFMLDIVAETGIRVGNKKYLDKHGSRGLTTLAPANVSFPSGSVAVLTFPGKHGVVNTATVRNRASVAFLRKAAALGQEYLMVYETARPGTFVRVNAQDFNTYVRERRGRTAKDFRTATANAEFDAVLRARGAPGSEAEARRNVTDAVRAAAAKLNNDPGVSRKSYILPGAGERYLASPKRYLAQLNRRKG